MATQKDKQNKWIREGDTVIAITGNHRGKTGKVMSRDGEGVVVQGLNVRKKHVKRSQANPQGNVLEFEMPIHASNLKLVTAEGKPVKVKVRVSKQGERELYHNDKDQQVLYRSVKKPK